MGLSKEEFEQRALAWEVHCKKSAASSSVSRYIKDPSYDALIALGKPAVPYIIERYRSDQLLWGFVLEDITGIRMVEDRAAFKPAELKKKWLDWWDEQQREK